MKYSKDCGLCRQRIVAGAVAAIDTRLTGINLNAVVLDDCYQHWLTPTTQPGKVVSDETG